MEKEQINADLVIYRLDKMESMMAEHNRVHESHMEKIEDLFNDLDSKYAGKWVETTAIWAGRIIGLALIGAILSLILIPSAKALF